MSIYASPWTNPSPGGANRSMLDEYWGQNPDLAYTDWLNKQNVNPYSVFGKFAQGQFNQTQDQFGVEAPKHDLNYSFVDYLNEHQGDLQKSFRGLAPQQRGQNQDAVAGRVKWVGF